MEEKMAIISSLKKETRFSELLIAAKRVYNILVKSPPYQIKESMLTEPDEKKLFNSTNQVKDKLTTSNFEALFELEAPINAFFDNILVMDEDNQKRENRLALLFAVKCNFDALGNFSKLAD
jgi:glycyl-tRNA synthetase beta chain